jgi:Na+/H+ antiporter NhaD/arsenite permease-like protein
VSGGRPPGIAGVGTLTIVAALSTVAALSWTAAEGGRGLSWSDFRSVAIVTLAIFVAMVALSRRAQR